MSNINLNQLQDILETKLVKRPNRDILVQKNILPDSKAAPSLQLKCNELKRARLADDLNEKLAKRPGPLELVESGILVTHDSTLTEAIKDGKISYPRTQPHSSILSNKSLNQSLDYLNNSYNLLNVVDDADLKNLNFNFNNNQQSDNASNTTFNFAPESSFNKSITSTNSIVSSTKPVTKTQTSILNKKSSQKSSFLINLNNNSNLKSIKPSLSGQSSSSGTASNNASNSSKKLIFHEYRGPNQKSFKTSVSLRSTSSGISKSKNSSKYNKNSESATANAAKRTLASVSVGSTSNLNTEILFEDSNSSSNSNSTTNTSINDQINSAYRIRLEQQKMFLLLDEIENDVDNKLEGDKSSPNRIEDNFNIDIDDDDLNLDSVSSANSMFNNSGVNSRISESKTVDTGDNSPRNEELSSAASTAPVVLSNLSEGFNQDEQMSSVGSSPAPTQYKLVNIEEMSVNELREECARRKLPKTGVKQKLIERLKNHALQINQQMIHQNKTSQLNKSSSLIISNDSSSSPSPSAPSINPIVQHLPLVNTSNNVKSPNLIESPINLDNQLNFITNEPIISHSSSATVSSSSSSSDYGTLTNNNEKLDEFLEFLTTENLTGTNINEEKSSDSLNNNPVNSSMSNGTISLAPSLDNNYQLLDNHIDNLIQYQIKTDQINNMSLNNSNLQIIKNDSINQSNIDDVNLSQNELENQRLAATLEVSLKNSAEILKQLSSAGQIEHLHQLEQQMKQSMQLIEKLKSLNNMQRHTDFPVYTESLRIATPLNQNKLRSISSMPSNLKEMELHCVKNNNTNQYEQNQLYNSSNDFREIINDKSKFIDQPSDFVLKLNSHIEKNESTYQNYQNSNNIDRQAKLINQSSSSNNLVLNNGYIINGSDNPAVLIKSETDKITNNIIRDHRSASLNNGPMTTKHTFPNFALSNSNDSNHLKQLKQEQIILTQSLSDKNLNSLMNGNNHNGNLFASATNLNYTNTNGIKNSTDITNQQTINMPNSFDMDWNDSELFDKLNQDFIDHKHDKISSQPAAVSMSSNTNKNEQFKTENFYPNEMNNICLTSNTLQQQNQIYHNKNAQGFNLNFDHNQIANGQNHHQLFRQLSNNSNNKLNFTLPVNQHNVLNGAILNPNACNTSSSSSSALGFMDNNHTNDNAFTFMLPLDDADLNQLTGFIQTPTI